MPEKTRIRIAQVGTVGVNVKDQERALEFYVGTLGFEKRRDVPYGDGARWIEVAPLGAETTIALVARPESQPTDTDTDAGTDAGTDTDTDAGTDTGIRFTTADADADHAELRARGVDADPEVLHWPGVPAMFSFRDPDGNVLFIVEQG